MDVREHAGLLTAEETAEMLGITSAMVRKMVEANVIVGTVVFRSTAIFPGTAHGDLLVSRDSVHAFMHRMRHRQHRVLAAAEAGRSGQPVPRYTL